jgi:hypothetical protein
MLYTLVLASAWRFLRALQRLAKLLYELFPIQYLNMDLYLPEVGYYLFRSTIQK